MCLSYVGWSSKQKGKPWCSWTHDLASNSGAWPCADAAGIHWQRLCILPIHIKEIFKEHFGAVYVLQTGSPYFPQLWSSKKQNSTARSTTEAELIACASALSGEALNLHTMTESLTEVRVPVSYQQDNQAAITVFQSGYSAKLRHPGRAHRTTESM